MTGTTVSGDLDLQNGAAHIIGTLPSVPGFAGEMLVVDGNAYERTPGQSKYTLESASNLFMNPADSANGPAAYFNSYILRSIADKTLNPQLLGTSDESGGSCYHIQVQAPPYFIKEKMGLVGDKPGVTTVDLWIYQSSFRVQRMELHTTELSGANAAARLVLSQYNSITPIRAPVPGQYETPGVETPAAS